MSLLSFIYYQEHITFFLDTVINPRIGKTVTISTFLFFFAFYERGHFKLNSTRWQCCSLHSQGKAEKLAFFVGCNSQATHIKSSPTHTF